MTSSSVLPADRSAYYKPLPYEAPGLTALPSQQPAVVNSGPSTTSGGSSGLTLVSTSPSPDASNFPAAPRNTAATPDLGHIYGRTVQADDRDRNPIIVIPGVLGSRLVDSQTGQIVWGEFGGDSINPASSGGARLIALPMSEAKPLVSLTDYVRPAGTLDALEIRVLGIPFQINAYRDLLTTLGVGGYRDEKTNLANINYGNQSYSSFQFDYDWRRDNVENSRRLHAFILEKKRYIEAERRDRHGKDLEPVRFDIVAHSMGGLVAR